MNKLFYPMYLDKKILKLIEDALKDPESEIYKSIKDELDKIDSGDNQYNNPMIEEELNNKVNKSDLGVPNGVATLDENGKVTCEQLPDDISSKWDTI